MKNLKFILILVLVLTLILSSLSVFALDSEPINEVARGKILYFEEFESEEKKSMEESGYDFSSYKVDVLITSGRFKGETITLTHHVMGDPVYDINLKTGRKVILDIQTSNNDIIEVNIADYQRDTTLYILVFLFLLLLLLVGKVKGLKTIITLLFTLALIIFLLIPGILKGFNPILLTIVICILTTSFTIPMVAGINKKAFAAILGTLLGVVVAGILAFVAGNLANLTGLSNEEARMLMYAPSSVAIDFKGLLFAGIIIGALGAIMDIAMSISSAMEEIYSHNNEMSIKDLIKSGMNVGRDVMGTMSNTLILAYTGTSIPLILLFTLYQTPLIKVLNLDMITTELIRALLGTIGLIVTIPLTTLIYGYIAKSTKK